jgi:vacuolar protein sorting-associated protein 13D
MMRKRGFINNTARISYLLCGPIFSQFLCSQEPYKRTQLWRMTSSGILFNEGSAPPFDPRKPSSSSAGFVLDVGHADPMTLMRNRRPLQLIVSKLSSQRKAYQTWSFTEVSFQYLIHW